MRISQGSHQGIIHLAGLGWRIAIDVLDAFELLKRCLSGWRAGGEERSHLTRLGQNLVQTNLDFIDHQESDL